MSYPGSKDWEKNKEIHSRLVAKKAVEKVYEALELCPDDYMMLSWDFLNNKVMGYDHLGKSTPVGDIYDIVTKGANVVSFKIRKPMVEQPARGT